MALSQAFNAGLILAMMLKLTNYFLIVPVLPALANEFGVSASVIAQTATVYEVGKLIGCVIFGYLSDDCNKLRMVLRAMLAYCVSCGLLVAVVYKSELLPAMRVAPTAMLATFFVVYGVASLLSIASQTGLSILRFVNDKEGYRKAMVVQSVLASVLQGGWLLVGSELVGTFGWRAPFLTVALIGCLSMGALWLTSTPDVMDACEPVDVRRSPAAESLLSKPASAAQNRPAPVSTAAVSLAARDIEAAGSAAAPRSAAQPRLSFAQRLGVLFGPSQRRYQAFILALGTATATMYSFPTVATLLLTEELGMERSTVTYLVVAPFAAGALVRVCTIFFLKKLAKSETFVYGGLSLLATGSAGMVAWTRLPGTVHAGELTAQLSAMQVMAPGLVLMLGVALTMPHCKAGAMLAVPDHVSGAATSLLKVSQLVFSSVVAFLVAHLYDGTAKPLGTVLAAMNVPSLLLFIAMVAASKRSVMSTDTSVDPEMGGAIVVSTKPVAPEQQREASDRVAIIRISSRSGSAIGMTVTTVPQRPEAPADDIGNGGGGSGGDGV